METARRLTLLLQTSNDSFGDGIGSLWGGAVVEMSRQVGSAERAEYIQAAQAGKVRVIVCSDLTSRGIDLPGVRLVVNYDPPNPKQCKYPTSVDLVPARQLDLTNDYVQVKYTSTEPVAQPEPTFLATV